MNEYEKNNISVIDFKSGAAFLCHDASVRVMPEFNCKDTKVNLAKAAGSSVTSLLYTNVGQVVAQYQAEWLSVDVNAKSVIYTALTQNDGEDARSTVVKLTCGSYTVEVTVTQDSKEPDLSLKVGQSVDDGIGMIFWVDPSDKMVGKAVSVKRQGGNPFEASVMSHNALSTVNGYANTALFTAPAAMMQWHTVSRWVRDGICLHVMSYGSCLMFTTVLDMLIRILLRLYLIS